MEKISIIKNVISWAAISPEECTVLVRELITEYNLKQNECFDSLSQTVAETPVKRRGGCPKKVKPEDVVATVPSENTQAAETPVKRRGGRPKKVKPEDIAATASSGNTQAAETPVKRRGGRPKKTKDEDEPSMAEIGQMADEELIAATANTDVRNLLDDEKTVVSKSKARRRNPAFSYLEDYSELKHVIMGAELPFEFLYKWNGRNLLSAYVLPDMMPEGIYIPYKNLMFGKYRGFIISFYDEHVITDVSEALQEAQNSFEGIDDEIWSVMNSLQWSVARNFISELNRMLRKVGGDALQGSYRTMSPRSTCAVGIGKFRYTIDVK